MTRLLLDTHALFWALYDDASLSDTAGAAVRDPANAVYATMVSAQEIALALSVGRWRAALDLLLHFEGRVASEGYGLIAPTSADYVNQLRLPDVRGHNDPYDKLIIAQAIGRGMVLVTADPHAPHYGVTCIEAGRGPRQERRGERIVPEGPLEAVGQPDANDLTAPEYRGNQLIFRKRDGELSVSTFDNGILVTYGWTVSTDLNHVKEYMANLPNHADKGFLFFNYGFLIRHEGSGIMLAPDEGAAIVAFLAKRYNLPVAIHLP